METFDMINTFQQKRTMLLSAANRRFSDKAILDGFKKRLKSLQETGDLRTVAAHGRWGITDAAPSGLVWMRNTGDFAGALIYEPNDFEQDLSKISAASGELSTFFRASMSPRLEADAKAILAHVKAAKDVNDAVKGP